MTTWDSTDYPLDGLLISAIPSTIREVEQTLEALFEREHEALGGSIGSGITGAEHKEGSAKCYYDASAPTTRPDGTTALTSADYGRLWIDSDTNELYIYTGLGGSAGWDLVSTEIISTLLGAARVFGSTLKSTGDFTVGSNKLVVTAASGNIVSAGSLDVASFVTTGGGFIDEDSMATNSDTKVPSQQSVKAYVDGRLTPSALTSKTVALDTAYQVSATKHAMLYIYAELDINQESGIQIKLGSSNPPTTIVNILEAKNYGSYVAASLWIPAGWYFEVERTEPTGTAPAITAHYIAFA